MKERLSMKHEKTQEITELVLKAAKKARIETSDQPEPELTKPLKWPLSCTIGPGLEGAIACETKVGYVNGAKGWLVYRGYDIFDLCAYSTFEETSYLLVHGKFPNKMQLKSFKKKLLDYKRMHRTNRMLMSFPIETMSPMAALRFGISIMRQNQTWRDKDVKGHRTGPIGSDEDSIPMETPPKGENKAIYEFKHKTFEKPAAGLLPDSLASDELESIYHLIAGVGAITATVARVRDKKMPLEPIPELSHAGNVLYMMTGKIPTPEAERILDISLILHADHGMNASTFAAMVVASTLSDIYFSVDTGVAALNGPLHGGANEQVIHMLEEIGPHENVKSWYEKERKKGAKIPGMGHRVYKAYDPRARVLGPLADYMAKKNKAIVPMLKTARSLEHEVITTLGQEKKVFPNVDFYSGIVYASMGIPPEFFTTMFAVSRVSGWTARVWEYLKHNRIFRPRAMYTGPFMKTINHDRYDD